MKIFVKYFEIFGRKTYSQLTFLENPQIYRRGNLVVVEEF